MQYRTKGNEVCHGRPVAVFDVALVVPDSLFHVQQAIITLTSAGNPQYYPIIRNHYLAKDFRRTGTRRCEDVASNTSQSQRTNCKSGMHHTNRETELDG
jgi:hypothetical protein